MNVLLVSVKEWDDRLACWKQFAIFVIIDFIF